MFVDANINNGGLVKAFKAPFDKPILGGLVSFSLFKLSNLAMYEN